MYYAQVLGAQEGKEYITCLGHDFSTALRAEVHPAKDVYSSCQYAQAGFSVAESRLNPFC